MLDKDNPQDIVPRTTEEKLDIQLLSAQSLILTEEDTSE